MWCGEMATGGDGFLTEEQRGVMQVAARNAENSGTSPKSSGLLFPEHQIKVSAGGRAPTGGFAVRHFRRSHSGKPIRVKKGCDSFSWCFVWICAFFSCLVEVRIREIVLWEEIIATFVLISRHYLYPLIILL